MYLSNKCQYDRKEEAAHQHRCIRKRLLTAKFHCKRSYHANDRNNTQEQQHVLSRTPEQQHGKKLYITKTKRFLMGEGAYRKPHTHKSYAHHYRLHQ